MSVARVRIAHVVHGLDMGGAEKPVVDVTRATDPTRFRTSVICLDAPGSQAARLQAEGFDVTAFGRRPGFGGTLAARLAGARVVFTEHGGSYPDLRKKKRVLANQVLFRLSSTHLAVSEFTRQALLNVEGFPADRVQVLSNGVPTAPRSDLKPPEPREELGHAARGREARASPTPGPSPGHRG
ncbi:MAG: hypothetical protein EXR76_03145 [Myxococcales bacterium]|nr:hypothetical protein [Myxococcales bacterium]